jgi:hypothetical protein
MVSCKSLSLNDFEITLDWKKPFLIGVYVHTYKNMTRPGIRFLHTYIMRTLWLLYVGNLFINFK